jgi:hypothetical protein
MHTCVAHKSKMQEYNAQVVISGCFLFVRCLLQFRRHFMTFMASGCNDTHFLRQIIELKANETKKRLLKFQHK